MIDLAYPVIFSSLASTLMGLTDTLLMGWVGTTAQGGVGLGSLLTWCCSCFFVGTLTVINTFVAQHVGAGDDRRCGPVAWHGLLLALGFGLLGVPIGLEVHRLVALFGAPPDVAAIASSYTRIRVLALLLAVLESGLTSFMRGIGDTRTPMKVALGTVLLNIPLNLWLVFGGLGVAPLGPDGSALATVIAQGAGVLTLVGLYFRRSLRERYGTGLRGWPRARELRALLAVGLPIGVTWLLEMATWTIFSAVTSTMGKVPLAAHNIVLQVIQLSFMPGIALSVAATTLVGQRLGARDPAAAERQGLAALKLAMLYMSVMGLLFLLAGDLIAAAFNRDPAVITTARGLFAIAAAFQLFDAMGMVSGGILRGAGDTRFPMLVSVGCSWLLFLPLVWLFGVRLGWGVQGSWLGATAYIVVLGVTLLGRVRSGRWKSFSVLQPDPVGAAGPRVRGDAPREV